MEAKKKNFMDSIFNAGDRVIDAGMETGTKSAKKISDLKNEKK